MYDLPEIREATAAWWQGLAQAFRRAGVRDVPDALSRLAPWRLWRHPALLFAQTCGYPLTHGLEGRVRLIATPCHAADGCHGPTYCSFVVVRADDPARTLGDLRERAVAVNGTDSFSGWHALRALAARESGAGSFFGDLVRTGAHRASLAAVSAGRADFAAIDCVTFALLARHAPGEAVGLRTLARTSEAPALPYVTGASSNDDTLSRLRAGLADALGDPALKPPRDALLIAGAEVLPLRAYDRIFASSPRGVSA